MSTQNSNPDPTSDWRKYPKGPNFLGIVIGACVVMLLIMVAAWFLLHKDTDKMIPHPNPQPNSLVQPLLRPGQRSLDC